MAHGNCIFWRKWLGLIFYLEAVLKLNDTCKQNVVVQKNLVLLQNQYKPSHLGKLINLIAGKKVHKGKIIVSNCENIIFAPQPVYGRYKYVN